MLTESQYELLHRFKDQVLTFSTYLPEEFLILSQHNYIEEVFVPGSHHGWTISPLGLEALERFEQYREKCAAEKRQQRFQNQISVASVLVPFVTFILGLIVEHLAGILDFLFSAR